MSTRTDPLDRTDYVQSLYDAGPTAVRVAGHGQMSAIRQWCEAERIRWGLLGESVMVVWAERERVASRVEEMRWKVDVLERETVV